MPGKTNKKPGDEEELGDDAVAAIGDLEEEVPEEEEVDVVASEEFEEDF